MSEIGRFNWTAIMREAMQVLLALYHSTALAKAGQVSDVTTYKQVN